MKFVRWLSAPLFLLLATAFDSKVVVGGFALQSSVCTRLRHLPTTSVVRMESSCNENNYSQSAAVSRKTFIKSASIIAAVSAMPRQANGAPLFTKERRQLELCLVAIYRVVYWAESVASDLGNSNLPLDARKQRYLEARLAAKSMLTGKIGGGANYKVLTLSSLQIPGCLEDLSEAYNTNVSETCREFYESIASLVEFDGMDTLTDPSPRSSLTLTQFDARKETFMRRVLAEKIVPLGKKIINSFPEEKISISQRYIQENYASEIFPKPLPVDE